MKTCSQPLHEDTFGGHLKVGLAQIAAMDISRGNHRDNKAVIRYLPWLYHPPLQCSKGKTLTIPGMRVKKAGNTPEFPWAHLELMSTLKIYDSGTYLVRKMEIGSHLRTYLLTQNALWHAANKQTCPPTKPSIVLMKNENFELRITTLMLDFN